ncbi:alpha-1,2-mannosidase (plasmid) [Acetobacter orientalis]|uniref:Alpha-1,2-mannosidase n=1 Tax=Acetobacter orientalis TaxID=146474 RepID=A0A2Z5ZN22_9PROT|nr:alpha-1,2-mannosidase [Acetobacter orientalis]
MATTEQNKNTSLLMHSKARFDYPFDLVGKLGCGVFCDSLKTTSGGKI